MRLEGHHRAWLAVAGAASLCLLGAAGDAARPDLPPAFREGLTFEQALSRAKEQGKPVLALFGAKWCGVCKSYQNGAFSDERVTERIREKMIAVYIDLDTQRAIATRYKVTSIPSIAAITDGERTLGAIGALSADEVLAWLDEAAAKSAGKRETR